MQIIRNTLLLNLTRQVIYFHVAKMFECKHLTHSLTNKRFYMYVYIYMSLIEKRYMR